MSHVTARLWCGICGVVEVSAETVTITMVTTLVPEHRNPMYHFTCPTCGEDQNRPLDTSTPDALERINTLRRGGTKSVPLPIRPDPGSAPPINHDDLLDWRLGGDKVLEQILNETPL